MPLYIQNDLYSIYLFHLMNGRLFLTLLPPLLSLLHSLRDLFPFAIFPRCWSVYLFWRWLSLFFVLLLSFFVAVVVVLFHCIRIDAHSSDYLMLPIRHFQPHALFLETFLLLHICAIYVFIFAFVASFFSSLYLVLFSFWQDFFFFPISLHPVLFSESIHFVCL